MPTGTVEVDFGAFPGSSHATVAVTGQSAILSTSMVEAFLMPADTTDHAADEHIVESIRVQAGPPSAGVGFTIHALNTSELFEPLESPGPSRFRTAAATVYGDVGRSVGGKGTMLYGKFKVGWVWR